MKIKPFKYDHSLSGYLNDRLHKVKKQIECQENKYIAETNEQELKDYYFSKLQVESLKLNIEEMSQIKIEEKIIKKNTVFGRETTEVKATVVEVRVPYFGEKELWKYCPSHFKLSGYPELEITDQTISFFLTITDNSYDENIFRKDIDQNISNLEEVLNNQEKDILEFNNDIIKEIETALDKKIQIAKKIYNSFKKQGIILDKYNIPQPYIVPIERKPSPIQKPTQKKTNKDPELAEEIYNHILIVMRSMSLVIERNPKSFLHLDEETIRTHFLLQLNGHYKGTATGETFNAVGKTDILINYQGKNIFIAECKFWKGKKAFNDAITQLLDYLSWRDTKCALIIFNRNKDTSKVLKEMHKVMESRKEFKKTVEYEPGGDSRYIFLKEADEEQEIIITTQIYDIPKN